MVTHTNIPRPSTVIKKETESISSKPTNNRWNKLHWTLPVISLICLFALFVQPVNHFDYVQATIQNIAKNFNNQTACIKEYTQ
jgi:hypothetical protein